MNMIIQPRQPTRCDACTVTAFVLCDHFIQARQLVAEKPSRKHTGVRRNSGPTRSLLIWLAALLLIICNQGAARRHLLLCLQQRSPDVFFSRY